MPEMITVEPKYSPKYRGKKEYFLVLSELLTAARFKGTYQEIAKLIGFPLVGNYMGAEIGHLLGEISQDEVNYGRPMLSAIVVSTAGHPGPGFFDLARNLNRLTATSREEELLFWEQEVAAVYKAWKTIIREQ
jgi:hypothetical protein